MSKNILKNKAAFLKDFFRQKGYQVKHTECVEAVSQIETAHCYNVAKNHEKVRILKMNEVLSFKEMKELDFSIDVVVPVDIDTIMNGIEALNEYVSETITGSDYALCDIGYEVYPHFYNEGCVAMRVTGYIQDPDVLDGYEDEDESYDEEYSSPEERFLSRLGYYVTPANVQNQWKWGWLGAEGQSDVSEELYDDADSALDAAWVDAVSETMGYFNMSDYEWDSLSEKQQKELMRDYFKLES